MARKPRTALTGEKLTIHSMSEPLPQAHYQRCPQCDTLFMLPVVKSTQSAYSLTCRLQKENGRYSGCGVIEYSGNKSIRTDTVFLSIRESEVLFSEDLCMIKRGQWELKTPDGSEIYYFSGELERIMAD